MELAKAKGQVVTSVPSALVFDEPLNPSEGPFNGLAEWYRNSGSLRAPSFCRDVRFIRG
jgi:hypothetical protein